MTQIPILRRGPPPATAVDVRLRWFKSRRMRERIWLGFVTIVLAFGALAMTLPAYWLVVCSLKNRDDLFAYPPKFLPQPVTLDNYIYALSGMVREHEFVDHPDNPYDFQYLPVWEGSVLPLYLKNTLTIIGVNIAGISLSTLTAYALARMRFKGREAIFWSVVGVMLMPGVATLIPMYVTYEKLGWINTFLPLTVPHCLGDPFMIFFLRQFFKTIPPELEDAAFIDGCGPTGIWWHIFLPLSKPALMVMALRVFHYWWNAFFGPLIYLHEKSLWTLQLGVTVYSDPYRRLWGLPMAYASVLTIVPLIVFFVGQRAFLKGIVFVGVRK